MYDTPSTPPGLSVEEGSWECELFTSSLTKPDILTQIPAMMRSAFEVSRSLIQNKPVRMGPTPPIITHRSGG